MTKENLKRVRAIAWKEFIQIKRDPRSLGLSLAIPIFLLFIFGYGLSLDIDHIRTVVWNRDGSQLSRDFLLNFEYSKYFKIIGHADNYRDIQHMIDSGKVLMALVIDRDFSHYLNSGKPAPLQLIIDGSDANTATIARGYVQTVVGTYNIKLFNSTFAEYGLRPPKSVDARSRIWFNEGLKSTWFIVPGVIGVIIMIISALVTSLCVAREWERGTMEQLISTPVKSTELIIGKFIPYFVIGFFDLGLGVLMARFLFGVPFKGSYFLFIVLSTLFLTGALAQGITISVVARSQLMASQLASLATLIPTILLSGFIYPIFNMPKALQTVTYLIPARYYIVILREMFLKGGGIDTMWDEMIFLVLFASLAFVLAIRKFKKKVILK
ncbi:MAG: hypothetical protein A2Z72_03245 [Omnitrophica bacterium RBG_13_46_9]|nr:MAG: hypothetical protein A2Z72_03245 [Omnitrophica bacterium RBG_13_46_9]